MKKKFNKNKIKNPKHEKLLPYGINSKTIILFKKIFGINPKKSLKNIQNKNFTKTKLNDFITTKQVPLKNTIKENISFLFLIKSSRATKHKKRFNINLINAKNKKK
jgi:hypothetical protein